MTHNVSLNMVNSEGNTVILSRITSHDLKWINKTTKQKSKTIADWLFMIRLSFAVKPVKCISRMTQSRLRMLGDNTCTTRRITDIWIVSIMSHMVCLLPP